MRQQLMNNPGIFENYLKEKVFEEKMANKNLSPATTRVLRSFGHIKSNLYFIRSGHGIKIYFIHKLFYDSNIIFHIVLIKFTRFV